MADVRVQAEELRGRLAGALARYLPAGPLEPDDAPVAATWLLEAELLGLPQFGVAMLARELTRLGPPAPATGDSGPLRIDARRVPGHLAMAGATRLAAAGASAAGIGATSITDVGALGVLGSAARRLAEAGLVGFVLANSAPIVAPWGGHGPAIGTNPIAAAAPRSDGPPLVVDYATSPTTVAALRRARTDGAPLPEPGGFDEAGRAVRDARSVHALAPGGRLGSLTGLTVELLAGIAAGGRPAAGSATGRSALVLALDPAAFGGTDAAEVATRLGIDWRAAGGHLPARFDALAPAGALPADLHVPGESLDALARALEGIDHD